MDVRRDGGRAPRLEPGDHGPGRFRGEPSPLPWHPDDPGDVCDAAAVRDRRLHEPDRLVRIARAHDPVVPRLPAIRRPPDDLVPVPGTQLVGRGRTAPGERVERSIREDAGHLGGIRDPQRDQAQAGGGQDPATLGRRGLVLAQADARPQLFGHPGGQHPGARLHLGQRHRLVGAVGQPHVAGAEDHARRVAHVDEQPHVRAVRDAERLRAASGHRPGGGDQPCRAARGRRRRGPNRTGRR